MGLLAAIGELLLQAEEEELLQQRAHEYQVSLSAYGRSGRSCHAILAHSRMVSALACVSQLMTLPKCQDQRHSALQCLQCQPLFRFTVGVTALSGQS